MSPSMFTPSMFTPSMLTPSMLTPAMIPLIMAPSAPIAPISEPTTAAPTQEGEAPTSTGGASLPPVEDPATGDYTGSKFNKDVGIEPFTVKFVGDFQLTPQVTYLIINTINGLIAPYLMREIAVLDYIDLDIKSKNATEDTTSRYLRDLQQSTSALFEISGKLELEGDTEEALAEWTPQRVTELVKDFFTGVELENLFTTLKNNGLTLEEIAMHDGNTDSIVTDEDTTTQSTNEGGDTGSSGGGKNNMTAVLVATICGGFVFIVLAAALYANIRRNRKKFQSARGMQSISESDTTNLRSGQDDLPDCNASASHVSFPHLLGDDGDDDDLEYMDDDTLRAIKGKKKKKRSKRDELAEANSWASISISSDKKEKKKKKKKRHNRHEAPTSSRQPGDEEDVYLSPEFG